MSKFNIWIADKIYIKQDCLNNIGAFKRRFTHILRNVTIREFTLYKGQDVIAVPVGYSKEAMTHLNTKPIIKDIRVSMQVPSITLLDFSGELRDAQKNLLSEWYDNNYKSGIIVAKAGFGKTVIASHLIATYRKPTLIIVPTIMILRQWQLSIKEFLGIEPTIIGKGAFELGNITVASSKSLVKSASIDKVKKLFSLIIVDEAHTACAPKCRNLVNSLYADQKIGLTATPYRKDKTDFHLQGMFGSNIVTSEHVGLQANIRRIYTKDSFTFNETTDYIEALSILAEDVSFSYRVADKIKEDYDKGRKIIVVSPRIEHLNLIEVRLQDLHVNVGRLRSVKNRDDDRHNAQLLVHMKEVGCVLLGTYQLIGTGFDCPVLDCMHLPYSYNNKGLFVQLVGRIERIYKDKPKPEFVEYVFLYKGYTKMQQNSRDNHYRGLGYNIINESI